MYQSWAAVKHFFLRSQRRTPPAPYDGTGTCWVEFGDETVARLDADFFGGPTPKAPLVGPSPEGIEEEARVHDIAEAPLVRLRKLTCSGGAGRGDDRTGLFAKLVPVAAGVRCWCESFATVAVISERAPVAQRIEQWFPKPCAQVRFPPGVPTLLSQVSRLGLRMGRARVSFLSRSGGLARRGSYHPGPPGVTAGWVGTAEPRRLSKSLQFVRRAHFSQITV